jgi:hypothetical protein
MTTTVMINQTKSAWLQSNPKSAQLRKLDSEKTAMGYKYVAIKSQFIRSPLQYVISGYFLFPRKSAKKIVAVIIPVISEGLFRLRATFILFFLKQQ